MQKTYRQFVCLLYSVTILIRPQSFIKQQSNCLQTAKWTKRLKISVVNSSYFIDFFLNWVKTRKCFSGARKFSKVKIRVKSSASIKLWKSSSGRVLNIAKFSILTHSCKAFCEMVYGFISRSDPSSQQQCYQLYPIFWLREWSYHINRLQALLS